MYSFLFRNVLRSFAAGFLRPARFRALFEFRFQNIQYLLQGSGVDPRALGQFFGRKFQYAFGRVAADALELIDDRFVDLILKFVQFLGGRQGSVAGADINRVV